MLFLLVLFVVFMVLVSVTYGIRRDCNKPYDRDLKLFGYWVHIDAGRTKSGCAQP
jgi:hypothetical protein